MQHSSLKTQHRVMFSQNETLLQMRNNANDSEWWSSVLHRPCFIALNNIQISLII